MRDSSRSGLPALLLSISALCAATLVTPAFAEPPTFADVRALLDQGRTDRAARAAEEGLSAADPGAIPGLRYLLFKAHVLDLAPGKEKLYRRVAGSKKKNGMEAYEALLERLEGDVRAEGAAVLPVLVEGLETGDSLDRLLALGLLEDMAREEGDLPWYAPAAGHGASPVAAALQASLAALGDCAMREDALGTKKAYAIDDQRDREPYLEAIFAALSGLEFLAQIDPASWGTAAAFALECRSAAGLAFEDRTRVRELAAALRGPLVERLEGSERLPARIDAVILLGRIGDCEDLDVVRSVAAGDGEIAEPAKIAADRILHRHGCPG